MPIATTPAAIQQQLHTALASVGEIEACALLDYPDYMNIGDHLIWLGTVFYLMDRAQTEIRYAASIKRFSESQLALQAGKTPILLQGGGNFGDLWPRYQQFREHIITQYRDRPIIILPQSLYFKNRANLFQTAQIYNAHPELTLFIRDDYSEAIANEYFHRCRIIKAPDMAFHLVDMPGLVSEVPSGSSVLYHCRQDIELHQSGNLVDLKIPGLVVEDWASYRWLFRDQMQSDSGWHFKIPGLVRLIREGWQRGLRDPQAWISRQLWTMFHPKATQLNMLAQSALHVRSWELMHCGIHQFRPHRLVITNRLHGHILCLLMHKPHIFLPNSYHKNESFYRTWTAAIPFCEFVTDRSKVQPALDRLANQSPIVT